MTNSLILPNSLPIVNYKQLIELFVIDEEY